MRRVRQLVTLGSAAALLTLVGMGGVAAAAAPAPGQAETLAISGVPVTFEVTVVHAKKQADGGIDPALEGLANYLEKSFPDYRSFKRLDQRAAQVAPGEQTSVSLPDRQTLSLRYISIEGGFVKVRLELNGLKTTVKVRAGGLFFQAGRPYRGGMLILGIRART